MPGSTATCPTRCAAATSPARVVVVVKDGQVLTAARLRLLPMSRSARRSIRSRTLFRPGSVSKLFTWTAVMQLVEQGKLDLDADVNHYLDFKIPRTTASRSRCARS